MEKNNKKIVMFDFDGVLADMLEHSYEIHKDINPDFKWEKFQDFSNGNFFDGYQKAVDDGSLIPSFDFYEQYEGRIKNLTINDIIHDAVLNLASKYTLVIISSTTSHIIKNFIEKENLSECFDWILGEDVHKSKVVKIKSVFEKYDVSPSSCVFITDTLGDIKEATTCDVPSIGVTWGLHAHAKLTEGKPVAIIDDPMLLVSTIENVLK